MPGFQINNSQLPQWYFYLIKLLYNRAFRIIAQTEEMKKEINKYFNIDNSKITVLFNPIDVKLMGQSNKLPDEVSYQ